MKLCPLMNLFLRPCHLLPELCWRCSAVSRPAQCPDSCSLIRVQTPVFRRCFDDMLAQSTSVADTVCNHVSPCQPCLMLPKR